TGQRYVVGDDDTVAEQAVMSDVRVSHHVTVRADDGSGSRLRAAMNGDAFAYAIAIAYADLALAIREGEVLRLAADDCAFIDDIVRAKRCVTFNTSVRANLCAVADGRVALDNGVRVDANVRAEPCAVRDNGGRVNLH